MPGVKNVKQSFVNAAASSNRQVLGLSSDSFLEKASYLLGFDGGVKDEFCKITTNIGFDFDFCAANFPAKKINKNKDGKIKAIYIVASVGKNGKNISSDVVAIQNALNKVGTLPKLVIDGVCGKKTIAAIERYQKGFLSLPDGFVEPNSITIEKLNSVYVTSGSQIINNISENLYKQAWPLDDYTSLLNFYGKPGSNIIKLKSPYPLRLAWDTASITNNISCNIKVRDSLERIFLSILNHYGSANEVKAANMDLYGGCFNVRKMRGSDQWSRHSWGIAIDIDPSHNGFTTPWPGEAIMPEAVIKIFEAEGWKSGARAWGRDAMHFQATR